MCVCILGHNYDASASVCAGRSKAIPRAYPEALCRSAPHFWPRPNALAIFCACRRPAAVPAATHRRTLSCPGHSALPAPGAQSVDQSAPAGLDWVAVSAPTEPRSLAGVNRQPQTEHCMCMFVCYGRCVLLFASSVHRHRDCFSSSVTLECSVG